MFDLVGVLVGVGVDSLHTVTVGGTGDTSLSRVDVVVETVQKTSDDLGGESLEDHLDVVRLVNGTGTHLVLVEGSHSPAEDALLGSHLGVKDLFPLLHELSVRKLELLERSLLSVVVKSGNSGTVNVLLVLATLLGGLFEGRRSLELRVVLDDRVIGDDDTVGICGGGAVEERRSLDELPALESVVTLDNNGVNVRDEEQGGKSGDTGTSTHGDTGNVRRRLLAET